MAVLHVIWPAPEHLHRRLYRSRNFGGFQCIIDSEPSAEPTAYQGDVHFHIRRWNTEEPSHSFLQFIWRLRWRPNCTAIARDRSAAIHCFDGRVGIKRIEISRGHGAPGFADVLFAFFLARDNTLLLAC